MTVKGQDETVAARPAPATLCDFCPAGTTCVDGECVSTEPTNPCATVRCASETTCVDGKCVDKCAAVRCKDGPCKVIDGSAKCGSSYCTCDNDCDNTEKCDDDVGGCFNPCDFVKLKCVANYTSQPVNHECRCVPTKQAPVEFETEA